MRPGGIRRRIAIKRRRKPLVGAPLRPSDTPLKRSRLKPRSDSMAALYAGPDGRRAFVSEFLAQNPLCMVRWQNCTNAAVDVHEVIARGIGGAIVPGAKAYRQGQRFVPVCRRCHGELDLQPDRAKEQGWIRPVT